MQKTPPGLITLVLSMLLAAGCVPAPAPVQKTKAPVIGVIGKSVHPYWSNVEAGVQVVVGRLARGQGDVEHALAIDD